MHRGLLRAGNERQRKCCATERRDEIAPLHSITSSTKEISRAGISRPSALAVFRLMYISTFVAR
jgi:hypothetical protein